MKLRFWAIATLFSFGAISLMGYTLQNGDVGSNGNQEEQSAQPSFSSSDVMFAQMMIPHHQQAVDMGTLAESRAFDPEVRALAAQIKSEQVPEIVQMNDWLNKENVGLDMGHEMAMDGMLTSKQFESLKAAKGHAFDKLYLEGMVAHHEGAIVMAQMVLKSRNPEVKALGEAIVTSQTKQITFLKDLIKKLG
jgi:uncharacterized protein (DUF305 family)